MVKRDTHCSSHIMSGTISLSLCFILLLMSSTEMLIEEI